MNIVRVAASAADLMNPDGAAWGAVPGHDFEMTPAPLNGNPRIAALSPFMEKSTAHGTVRQLAVRGAHNGEVLALRLAWRGAQHAQIADLHEFVDGVAVLFPLGAGASALTMGAPGQAVNAWYWKADLEAGAGIEVVAEGYGTSVRRAGPDSAVTARAAYAGGGWQVVLSRALDAGDGHVRFRPGQAAQLAFAVWDGGNRERAGRKSFSGEFVSVEMGA